MMWVVFMILLELWLATAAIVNILKIWDHIEMIRTSNKTAKIIQDKMEDMFKGEYIGKHFEKEED